MLLVPDSQQPNAGTVYLVYKGNGSIPEGAYDLTASIPGYSPLVDHMSVGITNSVRIYVNGSGEPNEPNQPGEEPSGLSISPDSVVLSTVEGGVNSTTLTADLTPVDAESEITWEVHPRSVATIDPMEDVATVTAVAEGFAVVTATTENGIVATSEIKVSNQPVVLAGNVLTTPGSGTSALASPDYFTVTADIEDNPAVPGNATVDSTSMFAWSTQNQSDINAKVANQNLDGSYTMTFPVNGWPVNNYFLNADDIEIHVYAQTRGKLVFVGGDFYHWINPYDSSDHDVAYIGFVQDLAFLTSTVFDGQETGITDRSLQMEGLRVSSCIDGVEVETDVHMQGIGWFSVLSDGKYYPDGAYAGTMNQNRQIEAVRFKLTGIGDEVSNYTIRYRAYSQDIGWGPWVENDAIAGTTGRNLQMEAVEIEIIPKESNELI